MLIEQICITIPELPMPNRVENAVSPLQIWSLFQTLPDKISTDEQRELLELLLKNNELEVVNVSDVAIFGAWPCSKWPIIRDKLCRVCLVYLLT